MKERLARREIRKDQLIISDILDHELDLDDTARSYSRNQEKNPSSKSIRRCH